MYIQPSGLSCPKDFLRGVQSNRSGDMSVWPSRGQHWRQDFSVFCTEHSGRGRSVFLVYYFFSPPSAAATRLVFALFLCLDSLASWGCLVQARWLIPGDYGFVGVCLGG